MRVKEKQNRVVTQEMLDNLERINRELARTLPIIADAALIPATDKGRLLLDKDLRVCRRMRDIAEDKNLKVHEKTEMLHSFAARIPPENAELAQLKNAVLRIKEDAKLQREELFFLKEELLLNIRGKSEPFFIHFLSEPASAAVQEALKKGHIVNPAILRNLTQTNWSGRTVFDYLKFRLENYRETKMLSEIKYLLHLVSRREIAYLESLKTPESTATFVENQAGFIDGLVETVQKNNMTKDVDFLKKLAEIKEEATKAKPDAIRVFQGMLNSLEKQIPTPSSPEEMYGFPDLAEKAGEIKKILQLIVKEYRSKDTLKMLSKNEHVKHLLRYQKEITYLLDILRIIPGNQEYIQSLRPELRKLVKESNPSDWSLFERFYHDIDKKKYDTKFMKMFGDRKTYDVFIETKERFHMWPKKWAEVIYNRIIALSDPREITREIIAAREEIKKALLLSQSQIRKNLLSLASALQKVVDDKIRKLGKESESAFEELEKTVEKRIEELSSPEEKKLRILSGIIKNHISERIAYWDRITEEMSKARDNIQRMMQSYQKMYDNMMGIIKNPEAITYRITKKSEEKIRVLGEVYQAINWLEKAQLNGTPHIDHISWLKSVVPRLNRADDAHQFHVGAQEQLRKAFGDRGYEVFNQLYILGWQALKEAHAIWTTLEKIGAHKVLQELKKRNVRISQALGIKEESEKRSVSIEPPSKEPVKAKLAA
ncbi:hypothetical protein D6764_01970 [Candidatus Woesearchaeota archaeon]|nr:MAG: hypothetical protein D6764_01970 [Candidatus Woesearchaeota archaeon]